MSKPCPLLPQSHNPQLTIIVIVEEIRDIGGDGVLSVVVNGSWTSPCHWQYCQQANEAIFVDSGHVRITNQRVTPAITWKPSATGTACGIQPTTITNSAGQTITTTLAAATPTNTPASASASATACPTPAPLSTGAGVGVGIGAGLAIAGVFAAIWVPLRRRCLKRVNGPPNGYMQDPSQIALQQQGYYGPKPVEAEGQHRVEMPNDPRIPLWTLSELPSTPHKRSPRLGH
ncbi:hypothetical protein DBV05_g7039 [Lasiodiplodia theobromae]|uniref:Uncharacterized protein n=1 Tax=Lasiodiplodia theobromae TaxID=45133 RepID=A0A5N5DAB6_9PEZI|nr:hypothetical protein DBV05_g7039 [Lasiodiplodia theobromae]